MDLAQAFELELLPVRLCFGSGYAARLPSILGDLGGTRPLLLGTAAAAQRHSKIFASLDGLNTTAFFEAEPHCPVEVVERCRQVFRDAGCDCVIAVGGGSTLGLGKILAAEEAAKWIALPTTYSGSEMTPIFGRKIGQEKRIRRDPRCRPDFVIYDPLLTRELPPHVAVTSGMNSIAHAVEALYPQRPNPVTPGLAEQALTAHRRGLRAIARGVADEAALSAAQYGGFLGGLLVSICGIALHHQLCHVIGGLFDLPHGETNSVILPHAVDYNLPAITAASNVVETVFEADHAARAIFDFATEIRAPQSLHELGMPESGIDAAVDTMLAHGGWNPRPLERAGLARLMRHAFEGTRP